MVVNLIVVVQLKPLRPGNLHHLPPPTTLPAENPQYHMFYSRSARLGLAVRVCNVGKECYKIGRKTRDLVLDYVIVRLPNHQLHGTSCYYRPSR